MEKKVRGDLRRRAVYNESGKRRSDEGEYEGAERQDESGSVSLHKHRLTYSG